MSIKKLITTTNEHARAALEITRDEYALCDYVMFRSADPKARKRGYCDDTRDEIAEFVGITRQGLHKMIARMQGKSLLELDALTGFLCVTSTYIDAINSKQSLHGNVNKVYSERKQSLHGNVNKVYNNKEYDISKNKDEYFNNNNPETEKLKIEIHEPVKVEVVEVEKKPFNYKEHLANGSTSPAREIFDKWLAGLDSDKEFEKAYFIGYALPLEKFATLLEKFKIIAQNQWETYPNAAKLKNHFLNWANAQVSREAREKTKPKQQKSNGRAQINNFGGDPSSYKQETL